MQIIVKNNSKSIKKISKFFIIIILCVIIGVVVFFINYASDLSYLFKDVNIGSTTIRVMPDSTAFHWYISEYNALDKQMYPASLTGPMIDASEKRMQGYGKYHMQMQYNLGNFINYCHNDSNFTSIIESKFPSDGINDSQTLYNNFISTYSGQAGYSVEVATKLNNIWNEMINASGPAFETLQDQFIVNKYLKPAMTKMRLSDAEFNEIFGRSGSYSLSLGAIDILDGDEFMTALLSSVYSDFYTADMSSISANEINIGRANLIPFLYNVDKTETSGVEIARYAYIAYIEGFLTAGRTDGFHYWEQEYESVFGESYNEGDYDIETLRVKFEKARDTLSSESEQGNKGNRLLGSNITQVISSPYNVSTQLAQTKNIINGILGDLHIDTDYKDLIAKNYLMVKHMMDNSHIDSTIKDYCQGVVFNESKFSQGQFDEKNTKTAVLSDFQLVTLKDYVIKKNETHSDDDSVFDGEELGAQVKHDITAFVKKKLNAGEDLWTKANAWKEFNDMIVVEGTSSADCKVYAKMYDYKSNPVLNDTDFDGLDDLEEKGKAPLSNNFKGSSMTTFDGNLNIDFNTDFRYLMHNDTKYNDELAQQSLIMANLARGETIDLTQKNINYGTMNIEQYMTKLGFKEIDQDTVLHEMGGMSGIAGYKYYIGYKSVDYYRKNRGVIGIFISELQNNAIYEKMVIDDTSIRNYNYYKEIAESLYNKIDISKLDSLVDKYDLKYCYWISGKGIAGGIAAELSHLIRNEKGDKNDIYCYTFGSPKTRIEAKNSYDNFIKNIINEDDYLTKTLVDQNAHRLGDEYNASINTDFKYNYKNLTRNNPKYTGDYMKLNSLNNRIIKYKTNRTLPQYFIKDLSKYLNKKVGRGTIVGDDFANSRQDTEIKEIITAYDNWTKNRELETASSVKAYWTLAKVLEGIDNKMTNDRKYENAYEAASSEVWDYDNKSWLSIIKQMGEWYVDNVYTYSGGNYGVHRYRYSNSTAEDWYKVFEEWGQPLYDAGSSPIYLAGNNGRIGKAQTKSGAYVNVNIDEDEEFYQREWKTKFSYHLDNASDKAKERRKQHFEDTNRRYPTADESTVDENTILEAGKDVDLYKMYELAFDDKDVKTRKQNGKAIVENQTRPEARLWYSCPKIGGKKARDDCSAFVATVIYKYLNDTLKVNSNRTTADDYTYNPYMTSSQFSNSRFSDKSILRTIERWFDCYEGEDEENRFSLTKAYPLEPGDILVRSGHVEIYLNPELSFGWGQVHNSYEDNPHAKAFRYHFGQVDEADPYNVEEGYYFYNLNDEEEGHYTKVYRLKEECKNYKIYTNSLGGTP